MNKIIPTIVISFLVGSVLGYVFGYAHGAVSLAPKIDAINKMFPAVSQRVSSVSGKISRIGGSTLILDGIVVSLNPFAGDYPATRQVSVTPGTKITRLTRKDPVELQKEMLVFQKELRAQTGGTLTAPTPFAETEITFSDLKAGDHVTAIAANDIASAASFEAIKIQVVATQ